LLILAARDYPLVFGTWKMCSLQHLSRSFRRLSWAKPK